MANITTQTIRVDLNTDRIIPSAFTHQNDTARTLVFDMYNGGMPYTMTGNTVKFAYKSPIVNGQYSVIAGASMASGTVSGNKVSVTLPVAYTKISGVGLLTMIITPSSGTIRPVNIKLVVHKSADGDDAIAMASDFPSRLDAIASQYYSQYVTEDIAELESDIYAMFTPLPVGYEATASIPPRNPDKSKKYVMPNGDVYAWSTHTVTEPYNANTGLINQRPVTNNPYNDLTAESGVLTSDLIPFSEDWVPNTADRTNSKVVISGISKIVPTYYNSSIIVYYYKADGSFIAALRSSQLESVNVELGSDIDLPLTFNIKDSNYGSSTWDKVGYVRILLGISTSGDITATDISNLVINVPYYDEESEIGGWVATGENIPRSKINELAQTVGELEEKVENILQINTTQNLYVVGDSIAGGYGVGGKQYSWVKHVIDRNGYDADKSKNLAESGLGFATASTSSHTVQDIVGGTSFADADVVIVELGINDWKNSNLLLSDVWSGMEYVFTKIRSDNPHCKLFYVLPFNAAFLGTYTTFYCLGTKGDSNAQRPYGNTLMEFIKMIKGRFSQSPLSGYDVHVIDMVECAAINRSNIEFNLLDHLHPTIEAQETLGAEIAQKIALNA